MQRWAYLLVACVPHARMMRPKCENGGLIRDRVEGNVADYCNDRGSDGWELVSAVNDPLSQRGEVIDLIFSDRSSTTYAPGMSVPASRPSPTRQPNVLRYR